MLIAAYTVVLVFLAALTFYALSEKRTSDHLSAYHEGACVRWKDMSNHWMTSYHSLIDEVVLQNRETTKLHAEEIRVMRSRHTESTEKMNTSLSIMAARMASLKLSANVDGLVVEDPSTTHARPENLVPWSAELNDFIQLIEHEDSRVAVEEYVEELRSEGKLDSEILEVLNMGDY